MPAGEQEVAEVGDQQCCLVSNDALEATKQLSVGMRRPPCIVDDSCEQESRVNYMYTVLCG